MKKILVISSADLDKHAGIVAKYAVESLKDLFEVSILTKKETSLKAKHILGFTEFVLKLKKFDSFIARKLFKSDPEYYMLDVGKNLLLTHRQIIKKLNNVKFDLILCVFIHDLTTTSEVIKLSKSLGSRLVFFPMDMHFFTGGCHYSGNCKKYETECGECPGLFSSEKYDISNSIFKNSLNELENSNLTIFAPSIEVFEQIKHSKLFGNQKIITSGVPIDAKVMFEDSDRQKLRSKYGISSNKYVLFFGAVYLNQTRKGGKELISILELLAHRIEDLNIEVVILVAGTGDLDIPIKLNNHVIKLGYLEIHQLREAFNCADVFLSTSIQDSGPMMINQSMMCGTPVISFSVGVARNLVDNGITGYRCDLGNIDLFVSNIITHIQLGAKERLVMRSNCKEKALSFSGYEIFSENISNVIYD